MPGHRPLCRYCRRCVRWPQGTHNTSLSLSLCNFQDGEGEEGRKEGRLLLPPSPPPHFPPHQHTPGAGHGNGSSSLGLGKVRAMAEEPFAVFPIPDALPGGDGSAGTSSSLDRAIDQLR